MYILLHISTLESAVTRKLVRYISRMYILHMLCLKEPTKMSRDILHVVIVCYIRWVRAAADGFMWFLSISWLMIRVVSGE